MKNFITKSDSSQPVGETAVYLRERLIQASNQFLIAEWLGKKAASASRKCLCPHSRFRKGGNENDRQPIALDNQFTLQLDAIHAWHLHVADPQCHASDPISRTLQRMQIEALRIQGSERSSGRLAGAGGPVQGLGPFAAPLRLVGDARPGQLWMKVRPDLCRALYFDVYKVLSSLRATIKACNRIHRGG